MHKQTWVGVTVLLLVVALAVLAACGGTTQGVAPEADGGQAATPTQEAVPTATVGATEPVAPTPTQQEAPTATVGASATVASTPTRQEVPTATVGATATVAATLTPTQEAAATATLAVFDGRALIQARCGSCHNAARVEQARKDRDGWEDTVRRMVEKGAQLTEDEEDALIEYLAKTYPQ